MKNLSKEQEIIKILFKDYLNYYNSRSISKVIGISHAGAFKILKKLEKRKVVIPKRIGKAIVYSLNLDNPISMREVEMALTLEAQNYNKWSEEFSGLVDLSDFVILFGSVLNNEKNAKDIDLLIVLDKENNKKIMEVIKERNKILSKKIHPIIQSPDDFKKDILNKNKVMIEIIKTGIVLFGQEEISKLIKKIR